eukprot:5480650-Karenia_brevis.AAC.1
MPIDFDAAKEILLCNLTKWEWSCARPSLQQLEDVLVALQDSGTGPDGLPYSSWKAHRKLAAKI